MTRRGERFVSMLFWSFCLLALAFLYIDDPDHTNGLMSALAAGGALGMRILHFANWKPLE